MKKRGILRQAAEHGRYGDTIIAHISPEEAGLLKRMGGAGTRNPKTGLLEFWVGEGDSDGGGTGESDDGVGGVNPSDSGNVVGVSPTAVAPSLDQQITMMLAPEVNPAQMMVQGIPGVIGMAPQALSMAANVIGQGINAITGANAIGAQQGQAVVGTGGVNGASFDNQMGEAVVPPPAPPPAPPIPTTPPPGGLLGIPGGRPYNVMLQNPNLRRGLLG